MPLPLLYPNIAEQVQLRAIGRVSGGSFCFSQGDLCLLGGCPSQKPVALVLLPGLGNA